MRVVSEKIPTGWRMVTLPYVEGESFTVTLVRHGFMPTSPLHPESAIAIDVLGLFHVMSGECPQLSRLAFAKGLFALNDVSPPASQRSSNDSTSTSASLSSSVAWAVRYGV